MEVQDQAKEIQGILENKEQGKALGELLRRLQDEEPESPTMIKTGMETFEEDKVQGKHLVIEWLTCTIFPMLD
ncbi:hypothetical protein, partial [Escherichia coli]|uniref:hypothetical protein n=1 Tax=Escherichia coli TaxID=562 RepID=UPI001C5A1404